MSGVSQRAVGYAGAMKRFGLIGSFKAQPGQGDALAKLLVQAAEALDANADCELYVVSRSPDDHDAVWVTEVWTSADAHQASLEDQTIRELITKATPHIAGLAERFELSPLGGKGLTPSESAR
jgi:quinol monooxygenase YgiN